MTKLIWKRTKNDNPMLAFWGLKAVVFPVKGGRWNYNVLGLDTGVAWGPKFATEADARVGAEAAFLKAREAHDWQTPGKQEWMSRIDAGLTEAPVQIVHASNYVRINADSDHETAKAMHFDGCPDKDGSCHSDRCGECWSQGFWVPKSKLFFDEEERCWCIDRGWAEEQDVEVSEEAPAHGGDK